MANIVADELSQIPMSPNLVATLARAADHASSRNNRDVTLEHVLAALLEDQDAGQILGSSVVDLPRLAASVAAHLDGAPGVASGDQPAELKLSPELARILSAAAAAAQQGRRPEISGAIVLAAIIGDGESTAARLLRAQGLTFDAAIRALQRAATAAMAAPVLARDQDGGEIPESGEFTVNSVAATPALMPSESARIEEAPRAAEPIRERAAPPSPPALPPDTREAGVGPGDIARDRRETTAGRRAGSGAAAAPPIDAPRPEFSYRPKDRTPEAVIQPGARQAPSLAPERPSGPADRLPAPWRVEAPPLVWSVPRKARTGTPVIVEARIPKAKIKMALDGSPDGRRELKAAKAIAARLRSPGDGFWIESGAPETQWIEDSQGLVTDDIAVWRWTVMPKKRGRARLQLLSSVRAVDAGGLVAQAALPDQTADIRVRANLARLSGRLFGWLVVGLAGWLLALYGTALWETAQQALAPYLARLT